MTLSAITHSSALIGSAYAPSLNAAFTELEASFGFWPVVLLPYGASRTAAQEQAVNPGGPTNSDHVKDRAVDINNQREFRNANQPLFLSILAKHGWKNVDVSGRFFPSEPWHFANQSATPAGEGTTVLENSTTPANRKRDHMDLIRVSSTDNSYTEAILTDYVHTQVVTAEFARNVMYCRKDITDKADGFDAVVAASNYAELKALPPFPAAAGAGGPVTVNAQVDVTPELIAALKDPTVLAALGAAIKVPTKIESVLS